MNERGNINILNNNNRFSMKEDMNDIRNNNNIIVKAILNVK